jgi:hypothetical protein
MEFITILDSLNITIVIVMAFAMALPFGIWGAYALNVMDSIQEVGNYSMQQDLAYPQHRPTPVFAQEGAEDGLSIGRLEEIFYGYTMEALEEALEVVAILAKDNRVLGFLGWASVSGVATNAGTSVVGTAFSWIQSPAPRWEPSPWVRVTQFRVPSSLMVLPAR